MKVHQRNSSGFEILRMSLSSLHGGFLKPKLLREIPDPVTGYPLRWEAADGAQSVTTDHPHVVDHVQLSSSLVDFSAKIWPPETFRGEPFFFRAVTPNARDPIRSVSGEACGRPPCWLQLCLRPARWGLEMFGGQI